MGFELAEVNVARLRASVDAAAMSGFRSLLDPVYRMAEASPGFVWRLGDGAGHDVVIRQVGADALVVNLSVWSSYEHLHEFTSRSAHGALVRRSAEWFLPARQPSAALWWVPAGVRPSAGEALRRLATLRADGPTPRAFTMRRRFSPDGEPVTARGSRGRR